MINIQPHITKLEVLKKYMEIWVEERHAYRIYWKMWVKKHNVPNPPPRLPDFETWFNDYYCAANN